MSKFLQREVKNDEDRLDLIESLSESDSRVQVPNNFGIPASTRKKAVYAYMITGNASETAELVGLDRRTIFNWRQTEWWKALTNEAKDLHAEQLDVSFTRVLDSLVTQIEDRLERGDEVVSKGGQKVRKELSARDMATILGILFDKRQINRNAPTTISRSNQEGQLEKMAERFAKLAHEANKRPGDDARIIDGELADEE